MADEKNMSVDDIMASCRKLDGTQEDGTTPQPDANASDGGSTDAGEPAATEQSGGTAPDSPTASTSGKPPGEMSVADILATARSEKKGAAQPTEPAKPVAKAKSKPAASKPAASKPAAAAKTSSKSAIPKDTSSILAAARKQAKPGPISKAEAAAKAEQTEKGTAKGKSKIPVPPMPEKPEYARPRPQTAATDGQDRRSFLGVFFGSFLAVGFTSLGLTHLLWLLGFARFMFPNILIEPPSTFRVGFPDDFSGGQVATRFKAQFGVWIVRHEYEGLAQIYALKSVCTHLGCTPNWLEAEQKFKCPCHGSGFYKDGINFEGPAPRPLERYFIALAPDGQLEVDKSKLYFEEKGQWKDPASYVSV